MSLHSRIKKLEAIRGRSQAEFFLCDWRHKEVDAEIIQMPTEDREGLALMDGKEIPVKYESSDTAMTQPDLDGGRLFWARRHDIIWIMMPLSTMLNLDDL